jgi:hypothetical protein
VLGRGIIALFKNPSLECVILDMRIDLFKSVEHQIL